MIGILYICTGKYVIFWKSFYLSCEKNFLPSHQKTYFVFTDAENIYAEKKNNVQKHYQENLGWPGNTLFRFEIFSKIEPHLKLCQYLFFLNGNIKFVNKVNDDILPNEINDGLVTVKHPGFYNKTNEEFTYERNKLSLAYIPFGKGEFYFMGGFNGGMTEHYLNLIHTLRNNIAIDFSNNIIAIWHDESHLNNYMLDKAPKVLTPEYGYPEGGELPFVPKVIILNKDNYGGHNFLRNISVTKKSKYEKVSILIIGRRFFKKVITYTNKRYQ